MRNNRQRAFFITLGAILLALVSATACAAINPQLTPFYTPPSPLPPGMPGEIIKTEPVETGSADVRAWRVMYHSRDLQNNDVAITGLFAVPTAPPPEGGYPLLAVAHGTEGLGQQCAPSLDPWNVPPPVADYISNPDTLVTPFVRAGYAVTMSDYQGLGAPGDASYLVGSIEAQNVLDSVRAIRAFDRIPLNSHNLVWGHSQGGHTVAFVAQLGEQIAPEIKVDGYVLSAPAAQLTSLVNTVLATDSPSPFTGIAAMVAASWSQTYKLPLDTILTPDGIAQIPVLYRECIFGAMGAYNSKPPKSYYFADPTTTPPWSDTAQLNTPKPMKYAAPVLLVQGTADQIVAPAITREFAQSLCDAGNTVEFKYFAGSDHLGLIHSSYTEVIGWLNARATDQPAPSNCDALPTPDGAAPPAANTPMNSQAFDHVILSDGAFTPDTATIMELEAALPAYIAQNQSKFSERNGPITERLITYKLQYWGESENGKQYIFINALCQSPANWQTQRVYVMDGGDCFFTLTYDPATKTFSNLSVNGEA